MTKHGNVSSNPGRREFIRNTALTAASFYIVPRHVLGRGFTAPSDKLLIAGVGAGGKGGDDIMHFAKSGNADIAFLCDVDDRRSADVVKQFPKAKYYHDWREMFDKESKNFDAVSVGTPDHNHAIVAFHAMQLGKHVYVQKPLTHDIFEARMLTEAAKRYKVVTQMGDQGSSNDGIRVLKEWYDADTIGDVHTIYCWTNRPVWPQGIAWPTQHPPVPPELNWDLWLGTAATREYVENVVPFNWRGWWDFGTGALGDMGCHIMGPVFKVLALGYPTEVTCSASTIYSGNFTQAYYPDSGPVSSAVHFKYKGKNGSDLKLHWMDGGIQPERPDELGANETMGDGGNGALFVGTKGKMMCATYGENPQLLPTSKTKETNVPQKYPRIAGGAEGHYKQWVDACIAGYGKTEVDSPFVEYAGPLTECILMGNLAVRSFNYRETSTTSTNGRGNNRYPGRGLTLQWDGTNMKVTNFDIANQYVKRQYRQGWTDLKF